MSSPTDTPHIHTDPDPIPQEKETWGRGMGHLAFAVTSLLAVLTMMACAGHTGL